MDSRYLNPVYDRGFPDPFVLKYCGEYWAYCTGIWPDGRWFGVLRSRDLAHWEELGGAMEPLEGDWPCRWAPEVSYDNGRFYLYYSLGDEETMHIRVAVAEHPAGPFHDSGRRLTGEPFAIDPHVFTDDDGARYLFYATDYLTHSRCGTGTARDRLIDPFTLAGSPAPITRAAYDWQIYDPERAEKGGVCWHTLEGPFVLRHKGRVYQMFSGGNWKSVSYGVSYALAGQEAGAEEWRQVADGETVLPILRTVPGKVLGPGHNSVVRAPDNRELYCVYHRWTLDGSARVMAVDPLDWAGERIFLLGPSTEPRPLALPTVADFFDGAGPDMGPVWMRDAGAWSSGKGVAAQTRAEPARAVCAHSLPCYLAEVSVAALDPGAQGGYGIALGQSARFLIEPGAGRAVASIRRGDAWEEQPLALPANFDPRAFHLLRAEVNAGHVAVTLDEGAARWESALSEAVWPLALATEGAPAAFAGFALTEGWADLFDRPGSPADLGWQSIEYFSPRSSRRARRPDESYKMRGLRELRELRGKHLPPIRRRARKGTAASLGEPRPAEYGWRIADGALQALTRPDGALLLKGPLPAAYELAVNLAIPGAALADSSAIIYPAVRADDPGPALTLSSTQSGWALAWRANGQALSLPLPPGFDGSQIHQLRIRVAGGQVGITLEGVSLGDAPAPVGASHVGLAAEGATAAFEMVRVTGI